MINCVFFFSSTKQFQNNQENNYSPSSSESMLTSWRDDEVTPILIAFSRRATPAWSRDDDP